VARGLSLLRGAGRGRTSASGEGRKSARRNPRETPGKKPKSRRTPQKPRPREHGRDPTNDGVVPAGDPDGVQGKESEKST